MKVVERQMLIDGLTFKRLLGIVFIKIRLNISFEFFALYIS